MIHFYPCGKSSDCNSPQHPLSHPPTHPAIHHPPTSHPQGPQATNQPATHPSQGIPHLPVRYINCFYFRFKCLSFTMRHAIWYVHSQAGDGWFQGYAPFRILNSACPGCPLHVHGISAICKHRNPSRTLEERPVHFHGNTLYPNAEVTTSRARAYCSKDGKRGAPLKITANVWKHKKYCLISKSLPTHN